MNEKIKLLKKLFLILIPVLVVIFYFEVKARGLENGFTLKKNLLEKNIEDINLVILGSSHGYFSINPDILNHKSFNLAYFSQDLYYDYMLFEKYKRNFKNLKCIVVSLSYFSLWYDLNDTPERWRKNFYNKYFDIKEKSPYSFADMIDVKSYSFAFFYRFDNTLFGSINTKLFSFGTKMNSLGWNTDTLNYSIDSSEALIEKGRERVEYTNTLINKNNLSDNIKILNELVKYSNENNIKLIFVSTPVSYPYLYYMDKTIYGEFLERVNGFTDSKNIFYLNYFSDKRFSMKDYYDYDHLNGKGANRFSGILKDTIENLKILN